MKKLSLFCLFILTFAHAQVTDSLLNLTIPLDQRVKLFLSRIEPFGYQASLALQLKKETVFVPQNQETVISWNKIKPYYRAIAFLDAQEERKFSLQNPIKSFYKNLPSYTNAISLHDLLSHQAGLHVVKNPQMTLDSLWWYVKKEKKSIYSVHHDTLADFIFEKMTGMKPLDWFISKIFIKIAGDSANGMDVLQFLKLEELLLFNKILQAPSLETLVRPYAIENGKAYSYAWQLSETIRQTPVAFLEDSSFALRVYPMEGLRMATCGPLSNQLADVLARYLSDGLPTLPPKIQNLKSGALDSIQGFWTGNGADFQMISEQNKVQILPQNALAFAFYFGKKLNKSINIIQQKFPITDSLIQYFPESKSEFITADSIIWLDQVEKTQYIIRLANQNRLYLLNLNLENHQIKEISPYNFPKQIFLPTSTQSLEAWIYPAFPKLKFSKTDQHWLLEVKNETIALSKKR